MKKFENPKINICKFNEEKVTTQSGTSTGLTAVQKAEAKAKSEGRFLLTW